MIFKTRRKKHQDNIGPKASDNQFEVIKGKDGCVYVSDEGKGDSFRWKKIKDPVRAQLWLKFNTPVDPKTIKKPKAKYTTLDNGDTPYVVFDYGNKVDVYFNRFIPKEDFVENGQFRVSPHILQGKIMEIPYKKIFVGANWLKTQCYDFAKGNTVVVETSPLHYIFIGDQIFEFQTVDPIKKLYSGLGNNSVPYPYAVGEKNTYLLLAEQNRGEKPHFVSISNEHLDLKKDAFLQYYHDESFFKPKFKKFPFKILFRRHQLSYND